MICYFFSLLWNHMGVKFSNDPLKVHILFTPKKIMRIPREGIYQSCSKNCEMSNFEFLPFFFFFVDMGPYGNKCFKRSLL